MAEEVQYATGGDSAGAKRKYEDQATPPPPSSGRRTTGFSAPITSQSPDSQPLSYNNVPPPVDEIQLAKQKAQEIAARLFNTAEAKRPKFENGGGFDSNDSKGFTPGPNDLIQKPIVNAATSYGYGNLSKTIAIPNGRVGVIIGKGGETIKYLQLQSGAKIQVTRDMDADPNSYTRSVELQGAADSIAKAEQLIKDVLAEAESGGSGIVSRRVTGQPGGAEQFVMQIPNNKVGLIIGKGGETIKNMQANTGARIQVIPLHLPPGDTSTERTLQIDGSSEQIEAAKQLVNEVISENRLRNQMGGGYSQQGYQARPPTSWAPPGPPMQQPGYGYTQPGAYPGAPGQYNMTQQPYANYPQQQASGGYAGGWDQTAAAQPTQQTAQGGYDYYGQQQAQQPQAPGGPAGPTDNSGYYIQGQGYTQDGYGGYHTSAPQSGYAQPQPGYDQQQGYGNPTQGYNVANQTSEGQTSSHGAQGDNTSQAPAPVQSSTPQSGYGQQPSPNPSYPPQGAAQPGYGVPPTSQPGYAAQPAGYAPTGYGPPQVQKPPVSQAAYAQPPQQSPTAAQGGYAQPAPVQPGYAQAGYAQPDPGAQRAPPSAYGTPGYAQPPYGAPPVAQSGYGGQQPPAYSGSYGSGYPQQAPPAYSSEAAPTAASQAVQPSGGVAKTSPQS